MEEGWIKVYRKMKEWTWFNDRYTLHLFMYLLLSVNREDGECNGIKVKAGSLVTSKSTNISIREATRWPLRAGRRARRPRRRWRTNRPRWRDCCR